MHGDIPAPLESGLSSDDVPRADEVGSEFMAGAGELVAERAHEGSECGVQRSAVGDGAGLARGRGGRVGVGMGGEGVGPAQVAACRVVEPQTSRKAREMDGRSGVAGGWWCWSSRRRGCARGRRRGSLDGVLGRRLDEAGSLRRAEMRRRLSPSALHLCREQGGRRVSGR